MDHAHVGVVILTCNDWRDTLACLERVHAQSGFPRRVIVCDNGSGNETADRILSGWEQLAARTGRPKPVEVFGDNQLSGPLALLRREENEGAAGGMNAALRLLLYDQECRAFWLLHHDALPENYALASLLHHAEESADVGIVGSTLLFQDKNLLECAAGGAWNRWTGSVKPIDQGLARFVLADHKDVVARLDFVNGASCLILRSVIEKIGLYDERFFLFFEDVEYSLRARKAGFRLTWAPGALVRHRAPHQAAGLTPILGVTEEPDLPRAKDYLYIRNRFFLLRRERPWALPVALVSLPFLLSGRLFRGRKKRARLVCRAAWDGASGRMEKAPQSVVFG
jgi:GT2 family glycosyltransferase